MNKYAQQTKPWNTCLDQARNNYNKDKISQRIQKHTHSVRAGDNESPRNVGGGREGWVKTNSLARSTSEMSMQPVLLLHQGRSGEMNKIYFTSSNEALPLTLV